jgi:hypothetical protein
VTEVFVPINVRREEERGKEQAAKINVMQKWVAILSNWSKFFTLGQL